MRKYVSLTVVAVLLLPNILSVKAYAKTDAADYLSAHNNSAWTVMGLSALGESGISAEHLKSINTGSAISIAAPILALTAIGEDPRTFGSGDYVALLESFYSNGQIGDEGALNDDMFGVLALVSAGRNDTAVVSATKSFILSNQNPDGGWGFAPGGSSDTNMTAAGVAVLAALGYSSTDSAVSSALDYLKDAQNDDGGFPYDPASSYGTESDSSSTAWVIWALNAVGVNPSAWSALAGTPISFLESMQSEDGFFKYQSESREDAFSPITTAYVVIALEGKILPLSSSGARFDGRFDFQINGSKGTLCSGRVTGPTALDIVKNASAICDYDYEITQTDFGPYLSRIGTDSAEGMIGWLYLVNFTAPSVGAADYILEPGDYVYWYYGAFDEQPTGQSIDLSVVVENGEVLGEEEEQEDTIGFVVEPGAFDFGILSPGESLEKTVTITNAGTRAVVIESAVTGDSLFRDNIRVGHESWRDFSVDLQVQESENHAVTLLIPLTYSSGGEKHGKLIFWANVD